MPHTIAARGRLHQMTTTLIHEIRINGIPSEPLAAISPQTPIEQEDDLMCSLEQEAEDPDELLQADEDQGER